MNATMQKQQKTAFEVYISRRLAEPSEAWRLVPEGCSPATSGEFVRAYATSESLRNMLIKAGPTLIVNDNKFSRSGTIEINKDGFCYIDITDYWILNPKRRGLVQKADDNTMVAYVNMDTSKTHKDSSVCDLGKSLFLSPYSTAYFGKAHVAYVRTTAENDSFRLADALRMIVRA